MPPSPTQSSTQVASDNLEAHPMHPSTPIPNHRSPHPLTHLSELSTIAPEAFAGQAPTRSGSGVCQQARRRACEESWCHLARGKENARATQRWIALGSGGGLRRRGDPLSVGHYPLRARMLSPRLPPDSGTVAPSWPFIVLVFFAPEPGISTNDLSSPYLLSRYRDWGGSRGTAAPSSYALVELLWSENCAPVSRGNRPFFNIAFDT